VDDELLLAAKAQIGSQHGLSAAQSARLVGDTAEAVHRDARAMANELNVYDPSERSRDETGRFTGDADRRDMNRLIREAAGRRLLATSSTCWFAQPSGDPSPWSTSTSRRLRVTSVEQQRHVGAVHRRRLQLDLS
jgi:hypothetical protein